jgi:hypothetical protein
LEQPEAVAPPREEWKRLDPRSVKVSRRVGAVTTAVIAVPSVLATVTTTFAVPLGALGGALAIGAALAASAFCGFLSWFLPERHYRHTRYRLDGLGLLILRGRIFHKQVGVLRSRIQHTDISQGPLERAFGLATLTVHTAGREEAQVGLSGIAFEEAQRIRRELTGLRTDDVV